MEAVLITVYLIIVVAMIAVILLQRSEGGGLGMGTAGSNGLISVRGTANLLTRTTAVLAALFMATAIGLTILSELDRGSQSILERAADGVGEGADAPTTVLDALNALQAEDTGLAVPPPAAGTDAPATEDVSPSADPALAVPSTDAPDAPADDGTEQPPAEGTAPETAEPPAAPTN
jgi:preprotein translocase subunit SecG